MGPILGPYSLLMEAFLDFQCKKGQENVKQELSKGSNIHPFAKIVGSGGA